MRGPGSSIVWKYFDKDYQNTNATCNLCNHLFRIPPSGTTTNLINHLRDKHKEFIKEKHAGKGATPTPSPSRNSAEQGPPEQERRWQFWKRPAEKDSTESERLQNSRRPVRRNSPEVDTSNFSMKEPKPEPEDEWSSNQETSGTGVAAADLLVDLDETEERSPTPLPTPPPPKRAKKANDTPNTSRRDASVVNNASNNATTSTNTSNNTEEFRVLGTFVASELSRAAEIDYTLASKASLAIQEALLNLKKELLNRRE